MEIQALIVLILIPVVKLKISQNLHLDINLKTPTFQLLNKIKWMLKLMKSLNLAKLMEKNLVKLKDLSIEIVKQLGLELMK